MIRLILSALILLETVLSHAFLLPTRTSTPSSRTLPPTSPCGTGTATPAMRSRFLRALARSSRTRTPSELKYAALDPMSQADSTKRGGCPFLVQSYEFRTFDVPVLFGGDSRPIILYDSRCNLCSKLLAKLIKYDYSNNLRFAPLQNRVGDLLLRRMSEEVRNEVVDNNVEGEVTAVNGAAANGAAENAEEKSYKSIVVCDPKRTYVKSSAVLEIMRLLANSDNVDDDNGVNKRYSKRFKVVQYLSLLSYIVPNRVRDRVYDFVTRRKRWFGSAAAATNSWDTDGRFVNDAILTGDRHAAKEGDFKSSTAINVFQSSNPPSRGSRIRIIYPSSAKGPSITYDDEFPNGLCLTGGIGTISTIDLPMRIVLRVERDSLGLERSGSEEGIIAWVKPEEVAPL
ncbi:hypothetical protein HJC23_011418 [Cyclotella cryptica]|uniref:Uncharacterized protein n=1 Tax=Cyclotella cryptica TaxID=29204 RepID=A0ABD3PMF4_9STRA|eukprot:CCRYP_013721-RA/>CCRYP_013721-RA protein AED:0.35 eAED:0.35 QI:291/1/1/1/1/1/2/103/398